jgi:hypothetical protein
MTTTLNWQVAASRAEEIRAFERATGDRPSRLRFRRTRTAEVRAPRAEQRRLP